MKSMELHHRSLGEGWGKILQGLSVTACWDSLSLLSNHIQLAVTSWGASTSMGGKEDV